MTKHFTVLLFIGLVREKAEKDISEIDYYELVAITAKQDFNLLSYFSLGLCSLYNTLLAFAAALIIPINI